jgi:hypothetical protein
MRGPSVEDVRRQLEGRLEVLEAASGHHVRLQRALSWWWGWERRLRREPELVRSVLDCESTYTEALERVLRRAESEGWPESAPGPAFLRDVRARRARLEALVHERLGWYVRTSGAPSLVEDLERLALLAQGLVELGPRPVPGPHELQKVGGLLPLLLGARRHEWSKWSHELGEEMERVEAERAAHLTGALELRRRLPGLVSGADHARLSPVACFMAAFREPSGAEQMGHAVLRPGSLVFLPEATGPGILRALAGPESPPIPGRVEVPWIVEQLRFLPSGTDFDTALARAAEAVGGRRWSLGTDSRLTLNGMELRFAEGASELRGQVTGPALKVAASLLFVRRW